MPSWMEYPVGAKTVAIELAVNDPDFAAAVGDTLFRVRRVTDNLYLDFADNKFKAAGHTKKEMSLVQSGPGRFRFTWDSSASIKSPLTVVIEYDSNGPEVFGVDNDFIAFTNSANILEKLAKTPLASVGDGEGTCKFTYTLTELNSTRAIPDASVYVTADVAGTNIIAGPKLTDGNGKVFFFLNSGVPNYFWRTKGGYRFSNPDLKNF
jgi:hypothetical protein